MTQYSNAVKIILIAYFSMLFIEWLLSRFLKKDAYNPMDTISGVSSGLTNNVKSLLKLTVVIMSYEFMVTHLALFEMKASPLAYILAFIGFDFAYYWRHRWAHEINFLWNRHLIHHSSEEFNLSAGMRQPISGFVEVYFFLYIPVALLGVPLVVVAVIAPLHRFAQFWYHTRLINKMGILEHIIVTPAHHRVHHAINADYIDKYYSAIFIIWDKLFGTFEEETVDNPPVFGIKKAVSTWNPFLINFMHISQLIKDSWRTDNWGDKFRIWYKKTGWRPKDMEQKYPITYVEDARTQIKYQTEASSMLIFWLVIQLVLHIAVQFHFVELLPVFSYWGLLVYGAFVGVSIFAYTSLMDRSWIAVPFELTKTIMGFSILNYYGGWFLLNEKFELSTFIIGGYLLLSLAITLYYSFSYKKMNYKFILVILILTTQSCKQVDYGLEPMNYELNETIDSGYDIQTEGNNPNDNIIFSSCNSYVYEYVITKADKKYFAKHVDKGSALGMFENWDFIETSKAKDSTYIQKFIYVQPKMAEGELSPNQSVINVNWLNSDNTLLLETKEGIIENHKNLWMHPLRSFQMWPTFTAPWPYVQFPIEIGNKYTWWKKLDGGWGSDKYIQWNKIIHFDYNYEVTGTEVLSVRESKINCYIIEAHGISEIGNTKVNFFFNPKIGFVKFEYELMDNSRIEMKMIDFELDCEEEYTLP